MNEVLPFVEKNIEFDDLCEPLSFFLLLYFGCKYKMYFAFEAIFIFLPSYHRHQINKTTKKHHASQGLRFHQAYEPWPVIWIPPTQWKIQELMVLN